MRQTVSERRMSIGYITSNIAAQGGSFRTNVALLSIALMTPRTLELESARREIQEVEVELGRLHREVDATPLQANIRLRDSESISSVKIAWWLKNPYNQFQKNS